LEYDGHDIGRRTPGHEMSTPEWSPVRISSNCFPLERDEVYCQGEEEIGDSVEVEYGGVIRSTSVVHSENGEWETREWIGERPRNEVVSCYIYVLFSGCLALMAVCMVLMFSVLVETGR
jgi:hypothetical protein